MIHVHGVQNKFMQDFCMERQRAAQITGSSPIRSWMCLRIHYSDAKLPDTDDVAADIRLLQTSATAHSLRMSEFGPREAGELLG